MDYYRRYVGDYQSKTGSLSMLEHGAYTLMLDAVYGTGRPLPLEEDRLFRLLRATTRPEQAAVREVLARYWTQEGDGWHNCRADKEIARAADVSAKAAASVSKRATKDQRMLNGRSSFVHRTMNER